MHYSTSHGENSSIEIDFMRSILHIIDTHNQLNKPKFFFFTGKFSKFIPLSMKIFYIHHCLEKYMSGQYRY